MFYDRAADLCRMLTETSQRGHTREVMRYRDWCGFWSPGFDQDLIRAAEMCANMDRYISLRLDKGANGSKWSDLAVCLSQRDPVFNAALPAWELIAGQPTPARVRWRQPLDIDAIIDAAMGLETGEPQWLEDE